MLTGVTNETVKQFSDAKQQATLEEPATINIGSTSLKHEASSAAPAGVQQSDQGQPNTAAVVANGSTVTTSLSSSDSVEAQQKFNLAQFEPVRILSSNSSHKNVSLLGHFSDLSRENYAIVVLEKTAFKEDQLLHRQQSSGSLVTKADHASSESEKGIVAAAIGKSFFTSKSRLRTEFVNDIYGNFLCEVDPEINLLKVTIIYPASEKHIVKYSAQARYLVEETAEDYRNITLPHLDQEQLSLEWLYNILEHRKEQERIVFEDPTAGVGFVLLPDLKWDGKTVEQLYLLALVRERGIRSLRDLTGAHLPLLRNIRARGTAAIRERYGLDASQLRIYLHYQPTFYHLHVHFTHLAYDAPGISCEKSHPLSTVIANLELASDYYQRVTLLCVLKEADKLYSKFQQANTKNRKNEEDIKQDGEEETAPSPAKRTKTD